MGKTPPASPTEKQGSLASFFGKKRGTKDRPEKLEVSETPTDPTGTQSSTSETQKVKRQKKKDDDLDVKKIDVFKTPNVKQSSENVSKNGGKDEEFVSPKFNDLNFNPAKIKIPLYKDHIRFEFVCSALDDIEALKGTGTGSKKAATLVLCNLFRSIIYEKPEDLLDTMCFILNKVVPDLTSALMGIGEHTILKVVSELYGSSEASLKSQLAEYEDLGALAAASRQTTRMLTVPPPLSIENVMTDMRLVAEVSGNTSQVKKKEKIMKLLRSGKRPEVKFLVRFFQQKMRIGIQSSTVYQALAHAVILTNPTNPSEQKSLKSENTERLLNEMEASVKEALARLPNLKTITLALLDGISSSDLLDKCQVETGTPINPMLAKPITGVEELLDKFKDEEFTCEYKYDGERCQIHRLADGTVKVFSRNMEHITEKYPDVVEICKEILKEDINEIIIDGEVVAWDKEKQKILSFQTLSTRRKKNVKTSEIAVPVMFFPFDCMKLNEESLLTKTLRERREILFASVKEIPDKCTFAIHTELSNLDEIETFLQEAVEGDCEGLIVKTLNSTYEPAKRSLNWTKLKKDYIDALGDSIDVVPIGAFYGRGKRSKFYGAFLLAIFDEESENYQSICKLGTGFSDENLQIVYDELSEKTIPSKKNYYNVSEKMVPDVWFEPCVVWEIKAADLSISPVHTAAFGLRSSSKGIALRFPRFVRFRNDKKPEESSSPSQIAEMYDQQNVFKKKKKSIKDEDAGELSDPVEDFEGF